MTVLAKELQKLGYGKAAEILTLQGKSQHAKNSNQRSAGSRRILVKHKKLQRLLSKFDSNVEVILLDDVVTTGATLASAHLVLDALGLYTCAAYTIAAAPAQT